MLQFDLNNIREVFKLPYGNHPAIADGYNVVVTRDPYGGHVVINDIVFSWIDGLHSWGMEVFRIDPCDRLWKSIKSKDEEQLLMATHPVAFRIAEAMGHALYP